MYSLYTALCTCRVVHLCIGKPSYHLPVKATCVYMHIYLWQCVQEVCPNSLYQLHNVLVQTKVLLLCTKIVTCVIATMYITEVSDKGSGISKCVHLSQAGFLAWCTIRVHFVGMVPTRPWCVYIGKPSKLMNAHFLYLFVHLAMLFPWTYTQ